MTAPSLQPTLVEPDHDRGYRRETNASCGRSIRATLGRHFARSPDGLLRKREVLHEHCETLGRDPGEITTTYHIRVEPNDDPRRIAEQVSGFADAGLDTAIMYLGPPLDPRNLSPLAEALIPLA